MNLKNKFFVQLAKLRNQIFLDVNVCAKGAASFSLTHSLTRPIPVPCLPSWLSSLKLLYRVTFSFSIEGRLGFLNLPSRYSSCQKRKQQNRNPKMEPYKERQKLLTCEPICETDIFDTCVINRLLIIYILKHFILITFQTL